MRGPIHWFEQEGTEETEMRGKFSDFSVFSGLTWHLSLLVSTRKNQPTDTIRNFHLVKVDQ
jgi:hypothetical protein